MIIALVNLEKSVRREEGDTLGAAQRADLLEIGIVDHYFIVDGLADAMLFKCEPQLLELIIVD